MAVLLAGVLLIGSSLVEAASPAAGVFGIPFTVGMLCLPVSFILLMRYLKFFRIYTREVFISYAETSME